MRIFSLLTLLIVSPLFAADKAEIAPAPRPVITLVGFNTTKTAVQADPNLFKSTTTANAVIGFVGVEISSDRQGKPMIADIAPESPAEQAGLQINDQLQKINNQPVDTVRSARDRLRGLTAGEAIRLTVMRSNKVSEVSVTPRPVSKPLTNTSTPTPTAPTPTRAVLGIQNESRPGGGVVITSITSGSAAEKAGVKVGDIVLKVDDGKVTESTPLRDLLANKKVGDVVLLSIKRGEKSIEVRATLQGEQLTGFGGRGSTSGWDDRLPTSWKKNSYRLAVIGVEYPDVKHNSKIKDSDWEASLFSLGAYNSKSATGQTVYGSMADYYKEISYGKFTVEGKFVGWVEVSKKRAEYSTGSGTSTLEKTSLLKEAMDKLVAKNKDALKDFDGVFILYAGGRVQTTRGGLYWPHRSSFSHNGKRWPYFIVQEGGDRMTDISVFCHEFGHMLGLPDLYSRPEVPGMEGVEVWCAMSQQNGEGRPQHFSAWSKLQLEWLKPVMIDPRVKQKIVLSPIEDDPEQCVKIPIRADGTEYLLLENRKKTRFDSVLPAEGLLIWRVLPGNGTQKVYLEESHGVEGPNGPRSFPTSVPFPSAANNSFTPYTTPSSKSQLGNGLDVYITNIRRLPDGRITFHIGYEYQ